MTTIIKRTRKSKKIVAPPEELEPYTGWMNIYIDKRGAYYPGGDFHKTREAARELAIRLGNCYNTILVKFYKP